MITQAWWYDVALCTYMCGVGDALVNYQQLVLACLAWAPLSQYQYIKVIYIIFDVGEWSGSSPKHVDNVCTPWWLVTLSGPSAHKDDCWHIGQAHTTPIWACTTYLRSIWCILMQGNATPALIQAYWIASGHKIIITKCTHVQLLLAHQARAPRLIYQCK